MGYARRRAFRAAAAALAVTVAMPGTAPANAATGTARDPRGDSTPPNDVTRVWVRNAGPTIRAVATYRDLSRPGHLGAALVVDPGSKGGTIFRLVRFQNFDGTWKVALWREPKDERRSSTVKCPGKRVRADVTESKIRFRLPRACLGKFQTRDRARFQIQGGQQEGGGVPQEFAPNRPLLVKRD